MNRREVPPLREPTRSLRSEREETASARSGRNDIDFKMVLGGGGIGFFGAEADQEED
jgi:hypothetical protein